MSGLINYFKKKLMIDYAEIYQNERQRHMMVPKDFEQQVLRLFDAYEKKAHEGHWIEKTFCKLNGKSWHRIVIESKIIVIRMFFGQWKRER